MGLREMMREIMSARQTPEPVWELFGIKEHEKVKITWSSLQMAPPELRDRFVAAVKELQAIAT